MLIGELLSREERFAAYGPQAVVDAWMTFVVPKAVSRNRVRLVDLKGQSHFNGRTGMCVEFDEAKGHYTVTLDNLTAEEDPPTRKVPHITMMVKAMNLVAIGPSARRD